MVKVWIRQIVPALVPLVVARGFDDALCFPNGLAGAGQQIIQNVIIGHVSPANAVRPKDRLKNAFSQASGN
jgi:hypothetical protein